MRSTFLALLVSACVSSLFAQSAAPQAYRETIAGTVVSFEMVPVPGGTVTLDGKPVDEIYDAYRNWMSQPEISEMFQTTREAIREYHSKSSETE